MIGNVGTVCVPNGPCLVPVFPDILAPSGVIVVGMSMVLRDLVQTYLGVVFSLAAIIVGTAISAFVAPAYIVLASASAFLLSELSDLLVYTKLAKNRPGLAVLLSGTVGSVVDSVVFLLLAFGNLQFLIGQVLGKIWASIAAVPVMKYLKK